MCCRWCIGVVVADLRLMLADTGVRLKRELIQLKIRVLVFVWRDHNRVCIPVLFLLVCITISQLYCLFSFWGEPGLWQLLLVTFYIVAVILSHTHLSVCSVMLTLRAFPRATPPLLPIPFPSRLCLDNMKIQNIISKTQRHSQVGEKSSVSIALHYRPFVLRLLIMLNVVTYICDRVRGNRVFVGKIEF